MDSASFTSKIQHVNKKSSDELLRKFAADDGDDEKEDARRELRLAKRRKRTVVSRGGRRGPLLEGEYCESPFSSNGSGSLAERKRLLLPPAVVARRSALLRQLGIGRSQQLLRAIDFRNKSLFGIIEKTWRKTVEGASRVFVEKQYGRHKLLINDAV